ncbi:competence protein CoiA family protein [Streptomyces sp. C10-9-1]|uniref:competence protein CoiA family protein n=1 Tax=Streptomyces sp. C10-9-1 TaxID=1859285 RepID=UPI002111DBF4|nr:competence protein CoiA family protein [Streptomyces sp. C10-9-1]MCQ6555440.1 competence protein CoiA family protein [Streptomyces sp. C10-9-1]
MTPFADEEDTRKVQTAVLGRAGSDDPVFLPYDHDEFDLFMRGRSRDDFYCGTLLGGCGKQLSAKRYTEKKCHFAHRPPVHCRRTANGESSADHLYIGRALQEWLRRQGHRQVTVTYPDLGAGPGDAVEVRFESSHRLIRVQMGRLPLRTWQADRDRLARTHPGGVHWSYGPDSGLAHNEVEEHGHAIRFSCRTERGTRQVYVGTQLPGHAVEWTTLAECRLTADGVIPPALDSRKPEPLPEPPTQVAFPLQAERIAFTGAVGIPEKQADGGRLYEADVQSEGSAVTRARIGLPSQTPAPRPHLIYALTGTADLVHPAESPWYIRAETATPLPHRTHPRWPDLHPAALTEPTRPPMMAEDAMVARFRTKLEQIHRSHGLINWETLVAHVGASPADFTSADRVRLLVAVDSPHTPDKPFLSAAVKLAHEAPGPAPFFAEVLAGLGVGKRLTEGEVDRIWRDSTRSATDRRETRAPEAWAETGRTGTGVDQELVRRLRRELMLVARARGRITWKSLLGKQGVLHTAIPETTRLGLLVAVDSPWKQGKPVLSALVKDKGRHGPDKVFGAVLKALGWKPSAGTPTADAAWPVERDRAYAAARNWTAPSIAAAKPGATRRGLTSRTVGMVDAVRRALIQAAARQVCVGWNTLAAAAGTEMGLLSDTDRCAILIAVDGYPQADGLLLPSLVIGPGHTPVPYFDDILRALNRPHGLRPIELGQVRKNEQARAFEAHAEPGSPAPREDHEEKPSPPAPSRPGRPQPPGPFPG